MLKKFLIVVSVVMLAACSTLQGLPDNISGSSEDCSGTSSTTGGGNLTSRFSGNYTIPVSYETTYSYRTDTP
jgi:predicted small secreted protein